MNVDHQITEFVAAAAIVPMLVQKARAGQGNLLKRFLNPTAVRESDEAAVDLMIRLDETDATA